MMQHKNTLLFITLAMFSQPLFAKTDELADKKFKQPRKPPKEAIAACLDRKAGDAVTFTTPKGHTIKAVCRAIKSPELIAVPVDKKHKTAAKQD